MQSAAVGLLLLLLALPASGAEVRDFSLVRLEAGDEGPVVLVLGGIQGDEPGGFYSAGLLATRYRVREGRLWVVPNLNFHSILRRHRGIYGDLNRKFAELPASDPEYALVSEIKALIERPEVGLVINLHDGSGFYRPQRLDAQRNPDRWGQSVVVDGLDFAAGDRNLGALAQAVVEGANTRLPVDWRLAVKNTATADGDREMQRALTWYVLGLGKPAFASEASKALDVAGRIITHLSIIEATLDLLGIRYERDFPLQSAAVEEALLADLQLRLSDGRICLPLADLRPRLRNLPSTGEHAVDHPLLALLASGDDHELRFGNRRLSQLYLESVETAPAVDLRVSIAGRERRVAPCDTIEAGDSAVRLAVPEGYRVNAIGAGGRDDQGRLLAQADFDPAYSLDRAGRLFRLEIYRGRAFAGTVNLRFGNPPVPRQLSANP